MEPTEEHYEGLRGEGRDQRVRARELLALVERHTVVAEVDEDVVLPALATALAEAEERGRREERRAIHALGARVSGRCDLDGLVRRKALCMHAECKAVKRFRAAIAARGPME